MPPENDPNAEALARGDLIPDPDDATTTDADVDTAAEEASADASKVEDEQAAAAADEADEAPKQEEDHRVPQSRFKEAVGKERSRAEAAEAELNKYRQREQQLAEAQDTEAAKAKQAELLTQHSKLLADGDLEKASEVMGEVLQLRDDMQNARMARTADNARNSAKIEVQYDNTVARLEAEYPEINPDSDDFDAGAVRRVQALVTGIMQNDGKNPAAALEEATDILLKPAKLAKNESLRDKPSEDAVESGMRRKQAQIDKNLDAAAKQPPATSDVGKDHDKTGGVLDAEAVSNMSWDEFVKVPDEELAKMRGDFIQ